MTDIRCERTHPHRRHLADDQYNYQGVHCPGIPDEGRPRLIETIAVMLAADGTIDPADAALHWAEEVGDRTREHFREQAAIIADAISAAETAENARPVTPSGETTTIPFTLTRRDPQDVIADLAVQLADARTALAAVTGSSSTERSDTLIARLTHDLDAARAAVLEAGHLAPGGIPFALDHVGRVLREGIAAMLVRCTDAERAKFDRIYPRGITDVDTTTLCGAWNQCKRTLDKRGTAVRNDNC